jgi:hypothetical protein
LIIIFICELAVGIAGFIYKEVHIQWENDALR